MSVVDIDILNSLLNAGLKKQEAETLAEKILTREEAAKSLATKEDVQAAKTDLQSSLNSQTKWIATMLIGQAALIVAFIQLFS